MSHYGEDFAQIGLCKSVCMVLGSFWQILMLISCSCTPFECFTEQMYPICLTGAFSHPVVKLLLSFVSVGVC